MTFNEASKRVLAPHQLIEQFTLKNSLGVEFKLWAIASDKTDECGYRVLAGSKNRNKAVWYPAAFFYWYWKGVTK